MLISICASLSLASILDEQHQFDDTHYRPIGYELSEADELSDSSVRVEASSCETASGSIFTYGKCPEKCIPFDMSTFAPQAAACAPLQQFGCNHDVCDDGVSSLAFSCSLDRKMVEEAKLCADDKVIFDRIEVKNFGKVKFHIDLNAPPAFTDIYMLADTTGSMGTAIKTARVRAEELVNIFGSRDHVAVGVGQYRDEKDFLEGFQHDQSLTENTAAALSAIKSWTTGGGGDRDEANLVALYKIATESSIGWRTGSRKFVVYFGDWPGHEPSCLGGKSITRQVVTDAMNAKNITVVAVNFKNLDNAPVSFPTSGCVGIKSSAVGQASFITGNTGGAVVSSTNQTKLVDAISKALSLVKRVYDVDDSDCVDKLTAVHTPSLPITLSPSQKTIVSSLLSLKTESICAGGHTFECSYKYTESGAAIKNGLSMKFVNIKGC